jgi:hypothetical protein
VALAIPGNLGHDPSSFPSVSTVSLPGEVAELTDGGGCDLVGAVAEADRVSTGFVRLMLRFSQALDQVSRDATAFLDWVENLMTHDGLDALDVLAEGVAGWVAGSLESGECPAEEPADLPESPCQA